MRKIDYSKSKEIITSKYYDQIEANRLKPLFWSEWEEKEIPVIWEDLMLKGPEHYFGYLNGDRRYPVSVKARETHTHMSIIGSTGSGKSVFANFIINNWCHRTGPEYLEIYGIDAKAVELTKYYQEGNSMPHFRVIAGTKDVEYMLSIMEYFTQQMNAQNKLLSKVNASDVESYYKITGTRLPSRILLIDELGEALRNCSSRQLARFSKYLDSIGALGRNTQHIIVFATQVVPAELDSSIMSHFGIRACLKVKLQKISELALGSGNDAAYYIKQKGFGYVNHEELTKETNKYFRIPYIDDDTLPKLIKHLYDKSLDEGFKPFTYYYNEGIRDVWKPGWETAIENSPNSFMLGHAGQYIHGQWYQDFEMRPIPAGTLMVLSPDEKGLELLREIIKLNLKSKEDTAKVRVYTSTFQKLKEYQNTLPNINMKGVGNAYASSEVHEHTNFLFTIRKQLKELISFLLIEGDEFDLDIDYNTYASLLESRRLSNVFTESFLNSDGTPTDSFNEYFGSYYAHLTKLADESFEFSPFFIIIDGIDEIEGFGIESRGMGINAMKQMIKEAPIYNIKFILIGEKLGEFTFDLKQSCVYRLMTRIPENVCAQISLDNGHLIIPQLGVLHNFSTDERRMFKLLPNAEDEEDLKDEEDSTKRGKGDEEI